MFTAEAIDFSFLEQLPKRERSKLTKVWDNFQALKVIAETEGLPVPQYFAAEILGVSRQRVHDLIEQGRLKTVVVGSTPFVTENSVVAYAQSERKAGRPPKSAILDSKGLVQAKAIWAVTKPRKK